jgi:3D (Asp-Asp-Asp) domain-containing protein
LFANAGISLRAATAGLVCLLLCEAAPAAPVKVGRALVTFYWVVDESSPKYRGDASAVLRDPRGRVIARTHRQFKIDLVRQGSGWLRDGRTVIYIKKVAGESRFRISRAKYGLGSTGCRLVPYRTIAVDPRFIRLGTKISIPQLKGTVLPDGTIHDGMFIAADRGHFRGAHVDLFVGAGPAGARPFIQHGYGSRSRVTVYAAGRTGRCRP